MLAAFPFSKPQKQKKREQSSFSLRSVFSLCFYRKFRICLIRLCSYLYYKFFAKNITCIDREVFLCSINLLVLQILTAQICKTRRFLYMKATGIVRRIDDLGRVVIPKEIRRTMRIREGDPLQTTLTRFDRFCVAVHNVYKRTTVE